jgi:hypothetical protein
MLPDSTGLGGLVLESGLLKGMAVSLWASKVPRNLDAAVLVPRRGRGVKWAACAGGEEKRLAAGQLTYSVSVHGNGFVCAGLHDGSIRVWSRATLKKNKGGADPDWAHSSSLGAGIDREMAHPRLA